MPPLFDFSEFPTLTTERLRLRRLTHDDAGQIVALMGDPEVLRYLNDPPRDTREKAIEFIDWLNGFFETKQSVQWAVTHRDEDKLVGVCNWHKWHASDRHVDIGYHFLRELWGRGYATEAAQAVIQWCFDNLDVHRIAADCTDGNIASERVLLKCGFTFEGISRESCWEHERFVSLKLFGLLRSEYEKR